MISLLSAWWVVFAPLIFIPLIYLLRRRKLGGWLAILVCLGSAWLMLQLPSEPGRFLGQPIVFTDVWRAATALLFVATACLFGVSLIASQGWTFYPFSVIILFLLGLAMLSRHLGIIALIIEIAVLFAIFIIQGGRLGSVRAASRFLVMMTLAVPLFLLAAWQSELYRENLDNPQFLTQMALLVVAGFSLWLGAAPLHGWISAIALEAKPGIATFIFITFPTAAIVILLNLLGQSPWLVDVPNAPEVIILAGLFSVVVGGLFAATQNAFGPLLGYTALFDLGSSLIALGLGSQTGLSLVLYAALVRTVGLTLIGVSTAFIQAQTGGDSFTQARGLARLWPIPTIGWVIGGATIAGAPFTAGFISRWLLLQPLSNINPWWPPIILLGSLGVTVGYIKGLHALIDTTPPVPAPRQKWLLNLLIAALVVLCVGIGLFPQPVLQITRTLAQSLNIPVL